jgi:hypothetical protein
MIKPSTFTSRIGVRADYLSPPLTIVAVAITSLLALYVVAIFEQVRTALGLRQSSHNEIYAFALVDTGLAVQVIAAPVFDFIRIGRRKKIAFIRGFFDATAIIGYLDEFWCGRDGYGDPFTHWSAIRATNSLYFPSRPGIMRHEARRPQF